MTAPHETADPRATSATPAAKPEETAWTTPGYQVVDTSLECTAYVLTRR
jgi:hypothetical protein